MESTFAVASIVTAILLVTRALQRMLASDAALVPVAVRTRRTDRR